jgi:hypothetical protein
MKNREAFECYDHLLFEPLAAYGWQVEEIPWRSENVQWNRFGVVIVRSPWDYQEEPKRFLKALETIDASGARLENSLNLIQWNLDKRYLKDLQARGIPIVPTQWRDRLKQDELSSLFDTADAEELIIKPVIGANADDTYRLDRDIELARQEELRQVFANCPLMVQPFMKHIVDEGEYSLFYFDGAYSHTVLKTPEDGDFRVQEEHGGRLTAVDPPLRLQTAARQTVQALPETPLYARADFVRTAADDFALMELELIEPSLYFNMDAESPRRFSGALNKRMQQG